jgi:TolB protein
MDRKFCISALALTLTMTLTMTMTAMPAGAQWTNHYPQVEGYGHHTYLEQEHLPIISSGPAYPAPSPDGKRIAFAHEGWIWVLDLDTGTARRVTDGAGVDGRPRWSPDGLQLAFVRDTGNDTAVVIKRLEDGAETTIDSAAIDLDPDFSRDGKSLMYTSGREGRLAIWRRSLVDGGETKISEGTRARRSSRGLADGRLVFQSEDGAVRSIRIVNSDGEGERILFQQGWMANLDPDVHPTGTSLVYGVGDGNNLRLAVMDIAHPEVPRWLTSANGRALHPAFSWDGRTIFFVESDRKKQFALRKVNAAGGVPQEVPILSWDYGSRMGDVSISARSSEGIAIPARISIERSDGHPVVNPSGASFLNVANSTPYFYLDGSLELRLPEGSYRAVLTHGPFSVPQELAFTVSRNAPVARTATIRRIWDAAKAGYVSADHHVHLNASGVHELELADLLLPMRGENLDFAAPMAWNQYNRFVDASRIGQRAEAAGATAVLSQEVRSGFHGHVGLIGVDEAFHPWFYGPGDPVYVDEDFNNGDAIAFAARRGALATYVHPVAKAGDPFDNLEANPIPYELLVDGVLTPGVGIEIVCMWTSPLGTSEVWYRFLNIGRAMPSTSGTDMMANFYRTPAVGTARAYLPEASGGNGFDAALDQVRQGTGFVTTGPALLFSVDGSMSGQTVAAGSRKWQLDLTSVAAVDKVEIIVNGRVVQTLDGFAGGGSKRYSGEIVLPRGGWIAARSVGGETGGPSMTVLPFAHSSPIWIGRIGSTDPRAAKAAASDLLKALAVSESKFAQGYNGTIPPALAGRIDQARRELERIAN